MLYGKGNGELSEIQRGCEDAYQTTSKVNILKERINKALGQLEEDIILGVSPTEMPDKKVGIERLIKGIKDLGRECPQETRRYQLIMRKYDN